MSAETRPDIHSPYADERIEALARAVTADAERRQETERLVSGSGAVDAANVDVETLTIATPTPDVAE